MRWSWIGLMVAAGVGAVVLFSLRLEGEPARVVPDGKAVSARPEGPDGSDREVATEGVESGASIPSAPVGTSSKGLRETFAQTVERVARRWVGETMGADPLRRSRGDAPETRVVTFTLPMASRPIADVQVALRSQDGTVLIAGSLAQARADVARGQSEEPPFPRRWLVPLAPDHSAYELHGVRRQARDPRLWVTAFLGPPSVGEVHVVSIPLPTVSSSDRVELGVLEPTPTLFALTGLGAVERLDLEVQPSEWPHSLLLPFGSAFDGTETVRVLGLPNGPMEASLTARLRADPTARRWPETGTVSWHVGEHSGYRRVVREGDLEASSLAWVELARPELVEVRLEAASARERWRREEWRRARGGGQRPLPR